MMSDDQDGCEWVGECFFWYRPTWVVPDKRPLNGCVCVCIYVLFEKSIRIFAPELTSPGNERCASCVSAFSFAFYLLP